MLLGGSGWECREAGSGKREAGSGKRFLGLALHPYTGIGGSDRSSAKVVSPGAWTQRMVEPVVSTTPHDRRPVVDDATAGGAHARVEQPTSWAVSRWWDDPWSRGAWSLIGVGGTAETRRRLGTPVSNRLVLAGEATHPSEAGMTQGAYDEGVRAARWCIGQGHSRIAVVGAGVAGLGAARVLADAGVHVDVIEARHRIGGRIHSVGLDGTTVELGANWLQHGENNSLAQIAEQLSLKLVPTDFHAPVDLDLGDYPASTQHQTLLAELCRRAQDFVGPDRSVAQLVDEWLREGPRFSNHQICRMVDAEVYLEAGAPLSDLSARSGLEAGVGDGDRWIVGGYGQLLDHLARDLHILFGWPVDLVTCDQSGVSLTGPEGSFGADAAIITAPIAVISAGGLRFDPPLPEGHRTALGLLKSGRVEKVALRFARRWWPHAASGYLRVFGERVGGPGGDISEWLDVTDTVGTPTIIGLFVGAWVGEMWEGRSDAEVAGAAAAVLGRAVTRAAR